ncbi:MAG: phosphate ABC transporter ATP-binding protein PstB [Oscillospiraceae bacterium]|nr:phosphate ABC transporter ATP-binding protein PstB [Oscillospiraceae bacterium]
MSEKSRLRTENLNLYYGSRHALKDITMEIPSRAITAIIGPSGCGKSSLLRVFNRMNDLIPEARVEGNVYLDKISVYGEETDAVALRKKVGMVFQKPNPFPMSIFDNVVIGPRRHGVKHRDELESIAENCLRRVALWEDVKDNLRQSALNLPLGTQQQLCIARTLAIEPEVILMDESCSALDPESTMRVEELMTELAQSYTIMIVTHSMEQAARVSDMSAFMMIDDEKIGRLVEYGTTEQIFSTPKDKRTEDYITGRYG